MRRLPFDPRSWSLLPLLLVGLAARADVAPDIAAALRSPGPVLVVDCGVDRPHGPLAEKVADDLRALRRGVRPARVRAADLDQVHWEHANVVLLCSDPADPALLGLAPGIGFGKTPSGIQVAGMSLAGDDAGAVLCLPHPRDPTRWVMLLLGSNAAALRRLDRDIRNDIAASALLADDQGQRFAALIRSSESWTVHPGHPYRAGEATARFDEWRRSSGARVSHWDLDVQVEPGRGIGVQAGIEVPRSGESAWLQLTARAQGISCLEESPHRCVPYDTRDGRLLLEFETAGEGQRLEFSYSVPLDGRLDAWYVGEHSGYVMPESNWFPRVRGAPDEPYAERASCELDLRAGPDAVAIHPDAGSEHPPLLVWGEYQVVDGTLYLAAGAAGETADRARQLLRWLDRRDRAPDELRLVAVDRPTAWFGESILLAPPPLLEPGDVDPVDELVLERALTEEQVRLTEPGGRRVRVTGTATPAGPAVTVRLWRLRGRWWQEVDEGPVGEDGGFELEGKARGQVMVTAEAPGQVPAAVRTRSGGPVSLELRPPREVALLCLRCGPELRPRRFPLVEVTPGRFQVTIALGELHRRYGSFPYAFELDPGEEGRVLVLDPRRHPGQFPSFLTPEEFHSDRLVFDWRADQVRFWVEVPGGLLAPDGWIGDGTSAPAL